MALTELHLYIQGNIFIHISCMSVLLYLYFHSQTLWKLFFQQNGYLDLKVSLTSNVENICQYFSMKPLPIVRVTNSYVRLGNTLTGEQSRETLLTMLSGTVVQETWWDFKFNIWWLWYLLFFYLNILLGVFDVS